MLDLGFVLWMLVRLILSDERRVASAEPVTTADFTRDVKPILEKRCQPCHFPGGTMHARLPFDKPETIHKLGTKLFTRIKKDQEQAVIRAFLAAR